MLTTVVSGSRSVVAIFPTNHRLPANKSNMEEKTTNQTKKDKQKTDETRNNLGKAWMKHRDVCARSLQEFVNHLLAVHEVYCQHIGGIRPKSPDLEPGETEDASADGQEGEISDDSPHRETKYKPRKSRGNNPPRDDHHDDDWDRGHSPARSDVTPVPPPSRKRKRMSRKGAPPEATSRSPSFSRDSRSPSFSGSRDVSPDGEIVERNAYGPGPSGGTGKVYLGVCIRRLPLRSTDTSLKDGLYHEYKKYGKVTSVNISGQAEDRYAIVSFKKSEEASKALEVSDGKVFFGSTIEVSSHEGFPEDVDDENRIPDKDCDEYGPKATRTLYIRNLENDVRIPDLREIFRQFGEILEIDIKKQGTVSKYAFIQYADITSVVRARQHMDDELVGTNKIKTGFGKSMPTKCVWLGNVAEPVAEKYLMHQFSRFGPVTHAVIDRSRGRALLYFENMECAQSAVEGMRGRVVYGKKLQTDFASRACETAFYESMERTGQMQPGIRQESRPSRGFRGGGMSSREGFDSRSSGWSDYGEAAERSSRGGRSFPSSSRGTFQPRGSSRGSSGERMSGSRQGNFYHRGGYSEQGSSRGGEARQRYYSGGSFEYTSKSGIVYREERYTEDYDEYSYPQQERRAHHSLSPPPTKRRTSRGETVGSSSAGGTGEVAHYRARPSSGERESRYTERYTERYVPPPPPSGETERYSRRSSGNDEFSDNFADSDSQSVDQQSERSGRSSHRSSHHGGRNTSTTRTDFRSKAPSGEGYPERYTENYQDDDDDDDDKSEPPRSRSPTPPDQFSPGP